MQRIWLRPSNRFYTTIATSADSHRNPQPVVQLSPERRAGRAWRTAFNSLRTATLSPISDPRQWQWQWQWQAMNDELDRVEQALEDELLALGRGVAFFVCRECDLWHQTAISVPLPDAVYLRSKPYLRPVLRTRDEHDRFVLAVVSQERSRYFVSQIGQVEEVFQINAPNPRKVARGHHGAGDDKEGSVLDSIKHDARILAQAAELVLNRFE
jgi:hypothetical protein